MSFGQPLLLLSLVLAPLAAALFVLSERRRARYAVRFTNLEVLAAVVPASPRRRFLPPALILLSLASLCLALARPKQRVQVPFERATVILVLDVSTSMESTDIRPTRLEAAQQAIGSFLRELPQRLRVALIVFGGDAQIASPPTSDHAVVQASLNASGTFEGFGGTAIGDALALAVRVARQAVALQGQASRPSRPPGGAPDSSILLLSDGAQTAGTLTPSQGASLARRAGIPVYTIALGTPDLTGETGFALAPDPATLREIARATHGEFFAARSNAALQAAYSKLGSSIGWRPAEHEIAGRFLLAGAMLLSAGGLLSRLWSRCLP